MVLATINSIQAHNIFIANIYILKSEEGGRKNPFFIGYKPQFFIRTSDITGTIVENITDINQKMIIPGERVDLKISLLYKIALELNIKFSIREGGKTIGAGIITKIL